MAIIGGRAHSLEEIQALGRFGYPFAEMSFYDPEQIEDQLEDLLKLKSRYGLYYLAHYPREGNPLDVANLRNRFVPRLKRLFELSAAAGVEKGTIHFWLDARTIPPDVIRQKIELLAEMTTAAKSRGVVLCLENLSEPYSNFIPAFDQVPDLAMTLDIGHGQLLTEENTSFGFIQNCFDRIKHIHVHDNHGGTSPKDDLHLPLGRGIVDYPRIFSLLEKKGYSSTVTMELKPREMAETKVEILKYLSP
ncbi:MAG: sugar phosphate isomerase/epimerase [Deltaproteobacteria bacterium]|nr:sugar phosphate isomerase/epimerase [Deltaproteobacteria bacterium]